MLLIIFLGLIAKLAFVSGDCDDLGPSDGKVCFNSEVGISLMTRFLEQAGF